MEAVPLVERRTAEKSIHPQVRVWGARGSVPITAPGTQRYGGSTPCLELTFCGNQRIILDAGTGIQNLGRELITTKSPDLDFHVFLSHFHWDHLQGLPFFPPLYNPAVTVTFYSCRPPDQLREILHGQMVTPYFPILFEDLPASMRFVQLDERPFQLGVVEISTFALNHPQGAHGFKLSSEGKTVVYATDHEHGEAAADLRLLQAARGADILFYDAQFTPEEYLSHRGWGHGTWLEAARVGLEAEVKQLVLFHHDPAHDDLKIEAMVERANAIFPRTTAAAEGETIRILD